MILQTPPACKRKNLLKYYKIFKFFIILLLHISKERVKYLYPGSGFPFPFT